MRLYDDGTSCVGAKQEKFDEDMIETVQHGEYMQGIARKMSMHNVTALCMVVQVIDRTVRHGITNTNLCKALLAHCNRIVCFCAGH
jgi:hypothetical protein